VREGDVTTALPTMANATLDDVVRNLHCRKTGGFDSRHVPAAPLDAQHIPVVARQIPGSRLDRRIAAAGEDEPWFSAEKTRPRQVTATALAAQAKAIASASESF
jgi:hypothetical protein